MKNNIIVYIMVEMLLIMGFTACSNNTDNKNIPEKNNLFEEDAIKIDEKNDLEQKLAEYREKRESMTNIPMGGGVVGFGAPNIEDYGFDTNMAEYNKFDSRELNKAYETAKKYVENVLKINVETKTVVYECVDPRIIEIYEVEDKGRADGYDAENIFLCEYRDNGTWKYLILGREGKGNEWQVIHHGSSYKE